MWLRAPRRSLKRCAGACSLCSQHALPVAPSVAPRRRARTSRRLPRALVGVARPEAPGRPAPRAARPDVHVRVRHALDHAVCCSPTHVARAPSASGVARTSLPSQGHAAAGTARSRGSPDSLLRRADATLRARPPQPAAAPRTRCCAARRPPPARPAGTARRARSRCPLRRRSRTRRGRRPGGVPG